MRRVVIKKAKWKYLFNFYLWKNVRILSIEKHGQKENDTNSIKNTSKCD